MKKKILAMLLCAACVCSMTACGNKTEEAVQETETTEETAKEETSSETKKEGTEDESVTSSEFYEEGDDTTPIITGDYKLSDCIVLGEYKGMTVEMTVEEATDEDAKEYIKSNMQEEEVTDASAAVKDGDTVYISYEGAVNGVKKDECCSDGTNLVIGSDTYIAGFEDGLIGVKVGESTTLNLSFPDDYWDSGVAGQPVVFDVKVISITRKPDLTDAWVKNNTDGKYSTVDEYVKAAKEELQESNKKEAQDTAASELWSKAYENCTFLALPEELVIKGENSFESYYCEYESYGMERDEFVETYYGVTWEEYLKNNFQITVPQYDYLKNQYGRQIAKNTLMMQAMAEKEGLTEDSPEYKEFLDKMAEEQGMTTDDLVETYKDLGLYDYAMTKVLLQKLVEYNTIKEA